MFGHISIMVTFRFGFLSVVLIWKIFSSKKDSDNLAILFILVRFFFWFNASKRVLLYHFQVFALINYKDEYKVQQRGAWLMLTLLNCLPNNKILTANKSSKLSGLICALLVTSLLLVSYDIILFFVCFFRVCEINTLYI